MVAAVEVAVEAAVDAEEEVFVVVNQRDASFGAEGYLSEEGLARVLARVVDADGGESRDVEQEIALEHPVVTVTDEQVVCVVVEDVGLDGYLHE